MSHKNWKETTQDIGTITEGTKRVIVFNATPKIKPIKHIQPACSCTKVEYNPSTRELVVYYKAKVIPYHINGSMHTRKTINVTYIDNTSETLTFYGTIIKMKQYYV